MLYIWPDGETAQSNDNPSLGWAAENDWCGLQQNSDCGRKFVFFEEKYSF
jgi:hypothetical protein